MARRFFFFFLSGGSSEGKERKFLAFGQSEAFRILGTEPVSGQSDRRSLCRIYTLSG